ncbi:N-acetylmuramoyl-L-alanine amidase [Ureibacillus sp. MALMAid1270]|uniref:N-acetylmuramoyl-L-alanine amidase n=1 Tax=Ureibacillus sp. MALMAid1270 TaxID=3411629 RepID=UPI003BA7C3EA
MSKKKFSFLFFLVMITFTILTVSDASAKSRIVFPDVPSTLGGSEEIYYLVEQGVINGVPVNSGNIFKPNDFVTRAQAAKMVIIAGGFEPLVVTKSSFSDIDLERTPLLSSYVEKAVSLEFFEKTSGNKFYPDKPLTRGEMSKVLATALKLDVNSYVSLPSPFKDISKDNPYYKYINALYYNGITQGAYGKYDPSSELTREHFSIFVARAINDEFKLSVGEVGGVHVPNESEYIGKVVSTTNYLNVRSSKSTENKTNIVGQVNEGTIFKAYAIEGNWIKVVYQDKYAYISKEYAKFVDKDGNPINVKLRSVIASVNVSVYVENNQNTNIIGTISKGNSIDVFGVIGDWYLTKVNNIPGYIRISQTVEEQTNEEVPTENQNDRNTEDQEVGVTNLIGKATANSIRVRTQPTTTSSVLGELNRGDEVSVISINGFWAKVSYKGKEAYVHKSYLKLINQSGSPLKGRIIVLDPGHGGKDPGAVYSSYQEKKIVFDVTSNLKRKLEKAGATVYMTRSGDTYPTLQDRVKFAHDHYAEIFVSVHVNSASSSAALGTETYYSVTANDNEKEDYELASNINSQIVSNAKMVDRKVKRQDWYVVANSVFPSVLVELGFISNSSDRSKLISAEYQEIYADSIYQGILKYYSK